MNSKELINQNESEISEFKESLQLKDEIGQTISAFSNSKPEKCVKTGSLTIKNT